MAVIFPDAIGVVGVAAGIVTMPLAGYTVGIFFGKSNDEGVSESE